MQSHTIEILASNLALPLNSAVQKADGARFALMLSLLSEGLYAQPPQAEYDGGVAAKQHPVAVPTFHLDTSLNRALQQNSPHSFNLLNSLYNERDRYLYPASDIRPFPTHHSDNLPEKVGNPETLMREIAQSREQALLLG